MDKKIFVIIPVLMLAAVLVSGCVGQPTVTTTPVDGIVIKSFSTADSSISKDDATELRINIENQGAIDARNVVVTFTNLENSWRNGTSPYAKFTNAPRFEYARLRAPEPTKSTPGDFKDIFIFVKPPAEIPAGQPASDYKIGAWVFYDYNTTGSIALKAYDYNYYYNVLKGVLPEGEQTATVESSAAPVKIDVDPEYLSRPLVVNFDNGDIYERSFKIVIRNVGSGYPWAEEYGTFVGTMRTSGPFKFRECATKTINSDTFTITPDLQDIAKLKGKNSQAQITCTIYTDKATWGDQPKGDFKIFFDFGYRYYVSADTSILVSSPPR